MIQQEPNNLGVPLFLGDLDGALSRHVDSVDVHFRTKQPLHDFFTSAGRTAHERCLTSLIRGIDIGAGGDKNAHGLCAIPNPQIPKNGPSYITRACEMKQRLSVHDAVRIEAVAESSIEQKCDHLRMPFFHGTRQGFAIALVNCAQNRTMLKQQAHDPVMAIIRGRINWVISRIIIVIIIARFPFVHVCTCMQQQTHHFKAIRSGCVVQWSEPAKWSDHSHVDICTARYEELYDFHMPALSRQAQRSARYSSAAITATRDHLRGPAVELDVLTSTVLRLCQYIGICTKVKQHACNIGMPAICTSMKCSQIPRRGSVRDRRLGLR